MPRLGKSRKNAAVDRRASSSNKRKRERAKSTTRESGSNENAGNGVDGGSETNTSLSQFSELEIQNALHCIVGKSFKETPSSKLGEGFWVVVNVKAFAQISSGTRKKTRVDRDMAEEKGKKKKMMMKKRPRMDAANSENHLKYIIRNYVTFGCKFMEGSPGKALKKHGDEDDCILKDFTIDDIQERGLKFPLSATSLESLEKDIRLCFQDKKAHVESSISSTSISTPNSIGLADSPIANILSVPGGFSNASAYGELVSTWMFCQRFQHLIKLSPFTLQQFEGAVSCGSKHSILSTEVFTSLLRVLLVESADKEKQAFMAGTSGISNRGRGRPRTRNNKSVARAIDWEAGAANLRLKRMSDATWLECLREEIIEREPGLDLPKSWSPLEACLQICDQLIVKERELIKGDKPFSTLRGVASLRAGPSSNTYREARHLNLGAIRERLLSGFYDTDGGRDYDPPCFVCGKSHQTEVNPGILCEDCPACAHIKCLGLDRVPSGDWRCPVCSLRHEESKNEDKTSSKAKKNPLAIVSSGHLDVPTHECACSDLCLEGAWEGAWEPCLLIPMSLSESNRTPESPNSADFSSSAKYNVKIISSGKQYFNIPAHFIRKMQGAPESSRGDECKLGGPLLKQFQDSNLQPRENDYDKDRDPNFEVVHGRFAGGAEAFALDVRRTIKAYLENCRVPRFKDKRHPAMEEEALELLEEFEYLYRRMVGEVFPSSSSFDKYENDEKEIGAESQEAKTTPLHDFSRSIPVTNLHEKEKLRSLCITIAHAHSLSDGVPKTTDRILLLAWLRDQVMQSHLIQTHMNELVDRSALLKRQLRGLQSGSCLYFSHIAPAGPSKKNGEWRPEDGFTMVDLPKTQSTRLERIWIKRDRRQGRSVVGKTFVKNFPGFGLFQGVIKEFNLSTDASICSTFTVSFIDESLPLSYEFSCFSNNHEVSSNDLKPVIRNKKDMPFFLLSENLEMTASELRNCGVNIKLPSETKYDRARLFRKSSSRVAATDGTKAKLKGLHGKLLLKCQSDVAKALVGVGRDVLNTPISNNGLSPTIDPGTGKKNYTRTYGRDPLLMPGGRFISTLQLDHESILGISDADVDSYVAEQEDCNFQGKRRCSLKLLNFCRNGGKEDATIGEQTRKLYAPVLLRLLIWCEFEYVHIKISGHHRHFTSRIIVDPCMAGVWWTSIHTLFNHLLLRARIIIRSKLDEAGELQRKEEAARLENQRKEEAQMLQERSARLARESLMTKGIYVPNEEQGSVVGVKRIRDQAMANQGDEEKNLKRRKIPNDVMEVLASKDDYANYVFHRPGDENSLDSKGPGECVTENERFLAETSLYKAMIAAKIRLGQQERLQSELITLETKLRGSSHDSSQPWSNSFSLLGYDYALHQTYLGCDFNYNKYWFFGAYLDSAENGRLHVEDGTNGKWYTIDLHLPGSDSNVSCLQSLIKILKSQKKSGTGDIGFHRKMMHEHAANNVDMLLANLEFIKLSFPSTTIQHDSLVVPTGNVIVERACCDPSHVGRWFGAWEKCILMETPPDVGSMVSTASSSILSYDHKAEFVNVRSLKTGKEYIRVPRNLVRSVLTNNSSNESNAASDEKDASNVKFYSEKCLGAWSIDTSSDGRAWYIWNCTFSKMPLGMYLSAHGCFVKQTNSTGQGFKLGIKPHDQIIAVNGQVVTLSWTAADLVHYIKCALSRVGEVIFLIARPTTSTNLNTSAESIELIDSASRCTFSSQHTSHSWYINTYKTTSSSMSSEERKSRHSERKDIALRELVTNAPHWNKHRESIQEEYIQRKVDRVMWQWKYSQTGAGEKIAGDEAQREHILSESTKSILNREIQSVNTLDFGHNYWGQFQLHDSASLLSVVSTLSYLVSEYFPASSKLTCRSRLKHLENELAVDHLCVMSTKFQASDNRNTRLHSECQSYVCNQIRQEFAQEVDSFTPFNLHSVKRYRKQQSTYTSFLHSALLEIGRHMCSKMVSRSLFAGDSIAHSWLNLADLSWRRQVQYASRSLSALALLVQTLKCVALRFSVLSRDDCLNSLPEKERAPVPRVGQRVILNTSVYSDYLVADAVNMGKKKPRFIRSSSNNMPMEDDECVPLSDIFVPGASRAHDCLPDGLLMDCVVSHILTRSGGGNPYCLVYLSKPEIDPNLPPLFASMSMAEGEAGGNRNSSHHSENLSISNIRAAALAKAAECGIEESETKVEFDLLQAQKDAQKRLTVNPNDPTPWHCRGCLRKFQRQRGLSRHVLSCKGISAKTQAEKVAERRRERAIEKAKRDAEKAKAKAQNPEARRRALLKSASPKRLALLNDIKKTLAAMRKHYLVGPFLLPVDTDLVEDYADYVRTPMSVSILAKNNRHFKYSATSLFRKDLKLIRTNCETYCGMKLKKLKKALKVNELLSVPQNADNKETTHESESVDLKSQIDLYTELPKQAAILVADTNLLLDKIEQKMSGPEIKSVLNSICDQVCSHMAKDELTFERAGETLSLEGETALKSVLDFMIFKVASGKVRRRRKTHAQKIAELAAENIRRHGGVSRRSGRARRIKKSYNEKELENASRWKIEEAKERSRREVKTSGRPQRSMERTSVHHQSKGTTSTAVKSTNQSVAEKTKINQNNPPVKPTSNSVSPTSLTDAQLEERLANDRRLVAEDEASKIIGHSNSKNQNSADHKNQQAGFITTSLAPLGPSFSHLDEWPRKAILDDAIKFAESLGNKNLSNVEARPLVCCIRCKRLKNYSVPKLEDRPSIAGNKRLDFLLSPDVYFSAHKETEHQKSVKECLDSIILTLEQQDWDVQVPRLLGLEEQYIAFVQAHALKEFADLCDAYFKCGGRRSNLPHNMRDICDAWVIQSEFAMHQNPRESETLFQTVAKEQALYYMGTYLDRSKQLLVQSNSKLQINEVESDIDSNATPLRQLRRRLVETIDELGAKLSSPVSSKDVLKGLLSHDNATAKVKKVRLKERAASIKQFFKLGYDKYRCLELVSSGLLPEHFDLGFRMKKRKMELQHSDGPQKKRKSAVMTKSKFKSKLASKEKRGKKNRNRKKKEKTNTKNAKPHKPLVVPRDVRKCLNDILEKLQRQAGSTDDDPTFIIYREVQVSQVLGDLLEKVRHNVELEIQREQAAIKACLDNVISMVEQSGVHIDKIMCQNVKFIIGGSENSNRIAEEKSKRPLYALLCNSALNSRASRSFAKSMGGPSLGKPKNAKEIFREWLKSQNMDAEYTIDDIDKLYEALPGGDNLASRANLSSLDNPTTKRDFLDLAAIQHAEYSRFPLYGEVRAFKPMGEQADSAWRAKRRSPSSAFQLYVNHETHINSKRPVGEQLNLSKSKLAEAWEKLKEEDRSEFVELAKSEAEQFKSTAARQTMLIKEKFELLESKQRAIRLRQERPPRPPSAFMIFQKQLTSIYDNSSPSSFSEEETSDSMSLDDPWGSCSAWQLLSHEEKSIYFSLEKEEKEDQTERILQYQNKILLIDEERKGLRKHWLDERTRKRKVEELRIVELKRAKQNRREAMREAKRKAKNEKKRKRAELLGRHSRNLDSEDEEANQWRLRKENGSEYHPSVSPFKAECRRRRRVSKVRPRPLSAFAIFAREMRKGSTGREANSGVVKMNDMLAGASSREKVESFNDISDNVQSESAESESDSSNSGSSCSGSESSDESSNESSDESSDESSSGSCSESDNNAKDGESGDNSSLSHVKSRNKASRSRDMNKIFRKIWSQKTSFEKEMYKYLGMQEEMRYLQKLHAAQVPILQRDTEWHNAAAKLATDSLFVDGSSSGFAQWSRMYNGTRRVICKVENKRIRLPVYEKSLSTLAKISIDNPLWPKVPAGSIASGNETEAKPNGGENILSTPTQRVVCLVNGKRILPKSVKFDPRPVFCSGLRIIVSYEKEKPNVDESWFKATVLRTKGVKNEIAEGKLLVIVAYILCDLSFDLIESNI